MTAERYHFLEEYLRQCMGEGASDGGHVRRVLNAALLLAQTEENVDRDVLIAAALLHEIGRAEQAQAGETRPQVSARMAQTFLCEMGAEEDFCRRVGECIRTHRLRADDPPVSIEGKILCDAEKLDVAGTLGVARTLMYQGYVGHPLYSVGPDGTVLSGEEKAPSFYSEFRRKLHGLSARFLTSSGKLCAQKRSEAAENFFRDLRAEAAAGESGSAWRLLPKEATDHQRRVFNISLMLAGETEKITRAALADAVMRDAPQSPTGAAERVVSDAEMLDSVGALGMARRLGALGKVHGSLDELLNQELPERSFFTTQAKGIAAGREPAAEAFIAALRGELAENREAGERMLAEAICE